MGEDVRLRALDPARDRALLERLWAAALGPVWPLLPGALELLQDGLVAERAEHGVGVVALDWPGVPDDLPGAGMAVRRCWPSRRRPSRTG